MTKFPIEFLTTQSGAPAGSPVIWTGNEFVVSSSDAHNLQRISAAVTKINQDFGDFLDANQANLQKIPELSGYIANLTPRVSSLELSQSNNVKTISTLTTTLNSLATQLNPLNVRIGQLSNSITSMMTDSQTIRVANASLDARVKTLESAGGLATRMAVIESGYSEFDRRISPLETASSAAASDLQSLISRMTALEGRVSSLETNMQSVLTQLRNL